MCCANRTSTSGSNTGNDFNWGIGNCEFESKNSCGGSLQQLCLNSWYTTLPAAWPHTGLGGGDTQEAVSKQGYALRHDRLPWKGGFIVHSMSARGPEDYNICKDLSLKSQRALTEATLVWNCNLLQFQGNRWSSCSVLALETFVGLFRANVLVSKLLHTPSILCFCFGESNDPERKFGRSASLVLVCQRCSKSWRTNRTNYPLVWRLIQTRFLHPTAVVVLMQDTFRRLLEFAVGSCRQSGGITVTSWMDLYKSRTQTPLRGHIPTPTLSR